MYKKIYASIKAANEDMQERKENRYAPLIEKARKAINDVAKEKGYLYVLEASGLLTADGPDLLDDVKTKLGIK